MANYGIVAPSWRSLPSGVQNDFRGANFEKWYKDPHNNNAKLLDASQLLLEDEAGRPVEICQCTSTTGPATNGSGASGVHYYERNGFAVPSVK